MPRRPNSQQVSGLGWGSALCLFGNTNKVISVMLGSFIVSPKHDWHRSVHTVGALMGLIFSIRMRANPACDRFRYRHRSNRRGYSGSRRHSLQHKHWIETCWSYRHQRRLSRSGLAAGNIYGSRRERQISDTGTRRCFPHFRRCNRNQSLTKGRKRSTRCDGQCERGDRHDYIDRQ